MAQTSPSFNDATTARERAAAHALPHVERFNEYRAKARSGSAERRAFYRRMAEREETMVGVLVSIARATEDR